MKKCIKIGKVLCDTLHRETAASFKSEIQYILIHSGVTQNCDHMLWETIRCFIENIGHVRMARSDFWQFP